MFHFSQMFLISQNTLGVRILLIMFSAGSKANLTLMNTKLVVTFFYLDTSSKRF